MANFCQVAHVWWWHEQYTLSQDAVSQHGKVGCQKLVVYYPCIFRRRQRTRWIQINGSQAQVINPVTIYTLYNMKGYPDYSIQCAFCCNSLPASPSPLVYWKLVFCVSEHWAFFVKVFLEMNSLEGGEGSLVNKGGNFCSHKSSSAWKLQQPWMAFLWPLAFGLMCPNVVGLNNFLKAHVLWIGKSWKI